MLIFKKLVIFKVVFKSLLGRKFMNVDSVVLQSVLLLRNLFGFPILWPVP